MNSFSSIFGIFKKDQMAGRPSDLVLQFKSVDDTTVKVNSRKEIYTTGSPRVYSVATADSLTPETDEYEMYCVTALTDATLTINNHASSNPSQGQKLILRIEASGDDRTIAYGDEYVSKNATALPETATNGKTLYLGFIWNATDSTFDLVAVSEEA